MSIETPRLTAERIRKIGHTIMNYAARTPGHILWEKAISANKACYDLAFNVQHGVEKWEDGIKKAKGMLKRFSR